MNNFKRDMVRWDKYAILKTAREEGIREGEDKTSFKFVKNLITKTSCTDIQIAEIVNISASFVEKVRQELK